MGISGTPKNGTPWVPSILFPYHSHVRIPKDMRMVWVPRTISIRGHPLFNGVPGIGSVIWNCGALGLKVGNSSASDLPTLCYTFSSLPWKPGAWKISINAQNVRWGWYFWVGQRTMNLWTTKQAELDGSQHLIQCQEALDVLLTITGYIRKTCIYIYMCVCVCESKYQIYWICPPSQ